MTVQRILELIEIGSVDAPDARRLLRGQQMPNAIAQFIKDGTWASQGRYPTGAKGLRAAARDALDAIGRSQHD